MALAAFVSWVFRSVSLCALCAVILHRLWHLLILSISRQRLWVWTLQAAALCSPDGLSQQSGDRGKTDEVPILPVPLGPCHVVLQVHRFWGRHALAKVNHPNVGLAGAVVDEEEWAANHLGGCGSRAEDMRDRLAGGRETVWLNPLTPPPPQSPELFVTFCNFFTLLVFRVILTDKWLIVWGLLLVFNRSAF